MSSQAKTINILGITGSIGQAASDVIKTHPNLFDVNVISAHTDAQGLSEAGKNLSANTTVLTSKDNLLDTLEDEVDVILCAIVGMAGLESMLKAIEKSRVVLIANKEPLVAAGPLVIAAAKKHKTTLLPVDSEHNAIFQVFDENQKNSIKRIILTASGGPFLNATIDDMAMATPEQAIAHPNWSMGPKISIDSATMMNKALEVIEAHYLFDVPPEQIDVVIHPQSVVHSMVEYNDGSVLSQMGASDMRTPLANIMAWPERLETPGRTLDLTKLKQLDFEAPNPDKFPAIQMAYDCLHKGLYACITLNAANEVAVEHFLNNHIGFLDIVLCVKHMVDECQPKTLDTLENILDFDASIREATKHHIENRLEPRTAHAL